MIGTTLPGQQGVAGVAQEKTLDRAVAAGNWAWSCRRSLAPWAFARMRGCVIGQTKRRLDAANGVAVAGAGQGQVKLSQDVDRGGQRPGLGRRPGVQFAQDALDLLLFVQLEPAPVVAQLDHGQGLHPEGRAAGRLIMDDALHWPRKSALTGTHVTVAAHGDDRLLEGVRADRGIDGSVAGGLISRSWATRTCARMRPRAGLAESGMLPSLSKVRWISASRRGSDGNAAGKRGQARQAAFLLLGPQDRRAQVVAGFHRTQDDRNSPASSNAPSSARRTLSRTSCTPPRPVSGRRSSRRTASVVCCWRPCTSTRSVDGSRLSAACRPALKAV